MFVARREVAERVVASLDSGAGAAAPDEAVERYLEERGEAYRRLQGFMRMLALEGVSDLSAVTVAVRQVRGMVG
jgi:hypothetical protein